jgi:hypothetical protein
MTTDTKNQGCENCVYLLTSELCKGCIDPIHKRFRNHIVGDPFLHEWEMQYTGKKSIHIYGEADIIATDTPEQTFKRLFVLNPQNYKISIKKTGYAITVIELEVCGELFFIVFTNKQLQSVSQVQGNTIIKKWNLFDPKRK